MPEHREVRGQARKHLHCLGCFLPSLDDLCRNTLDRRGPQGAPRVPGECCHGNVPLGLREGRA